MLGKYVCRKQSYILYLNFTTLHHTSLRSCSYQQIIASCIFLFSHNKFPEIFNGRFINTEELMNSLFFLDMFSEYLSAFCLKIGLFGAGLGYAPLTPWDITDIMLNHAYVNRSVTTRDQYKLKKGRFCFGSYKIQYTMEKTNNCEQYQVIIGQISNDGWHMVVLTTDSFDGEFVEVDQTKIKLDDEVKLSGGLRWYGPTLSGKPYGLGKLYSAHGNLIYYGCMLDDQRVLYGKEFRDEEEPKLVYEGGLVNGMRYGVGILYKQDGSEEYSGEWIENNPSSNETNNS